MSRKTWPVAFAFLACMLVGAYFVPKLGPALAKNDSRAEVSGTEPPLIQLTPDGTSTRLKVTPVDLSEVSAKLAQLERELKSSMSSMSLYPPGDDKAGSEKASGETTSNLPNGAVPPPPPLSASVPVPSVTAPETAAQVQQPPMIPPPAPQSDSAIDKVLGIINNALPTIGAPPAVVSSADSVPPSVPPAPAPLAAPNAPPAVAPSVPPPSVSPPSVVPPPPPEIAPSRPVPPAPSTVVAPPEPPMAPAVSNPVSAPPTEPVTPIPPPAATVSTPPAPNVTAPNVSAPTVPAAPIPPFTANPMPAPVPDVGAPAIAPTAPDAFAPENFAPKAPVDVPVIGSGVPAQQPVDPVAEPRKVPATTTVLAAAKPITSPWTFHLELVDGKNLITARVGQTIQFSVECDKVEMKSPHGNIAAMGNVKISSSGLQANGERMTILLQKDSIQLEGNAHLKCRRDNQEIELNSEQFTLRLSEISNIQQASGERRPPIIRYYRENQ